MFDRTNDNRNGYLSLPPEETKITSSDFKELPVGNNYTITADTENHFRNSFKKRSLKLRIYVAFFGGGDWGGTLKNPLDPQFGYTEYGKPFLKNESNIKI